MLFSMFYGIILNMLKASPKNILVKHVAYAKILHQYNELLKKDGKVNDLKFYREVILPEIPNYKMASWYQFLKRFKSSAGIIAVDPNQTRESNTPMALDVEKETKATIMTNQEATAKLISSILNISASRAQDIIDNPSLLTAKEALELGLKGMRAQDSRIHAVGKIREDNREQERFEKAFDSSAYGG